MTNAQRIRKAPPVLWGWTDYPLEAFGDEAGVKAPVRECFVIAYDGNKYVDVVVFGDGSRVTTASIKSGYVYTTPGRCGEVDPFLHKDLLTLNRMVRPDDH